MIKSFGFECFDQSEWSYASVVGMLLYVLNNTRPDITFAVSQVARFTVNPKKSHGVAIRDQKFVNTLRSSVHLKSTLFCTTKFSSN